MTATIGPPPAVTAGRRGSRRTLLRGLGIALALLPGVVVLGIALAGPLFVADADLRKGGIPFRGPDPGHLFGTDHLGRDVFALFLDGGTTIVLLPLIATAVGTVVGVSVGMVTGWYPGRLAALTLRASELLLALPSLLLTVLVVYAFSDAGLTALVVMVALLGVPGTVRYTHSVTATVARRGFVDHAVALGESTPSVLLREVLPAILGPVLADGGLRLVGAVYVVASVSFLGFVDPDTAGWAGMVADGITGTALNPWALLLPALGVVIFAVSVNLLADRVADRYRRSG